MMGCKCAHVEMISKEVASLSSKPFFEFAWQVRNNSIKVAPTAQSLPEAAASLSGVAAGPQG